MKSYSKFILFLLLFATLSNFAQDSTSVSVSKNLYKINFLAPGFSYEHGITKKSTLFAEIGFGLGYRWSDYYGDDFYVAPFVTAEYRYYYNLEKRLKKGKNIFGNSGNYLGSNIIYYFVPFGHENENFEPNTAINVFWGMQRTYKKNFNLGLQGGVQYVFNNDGDSGFYPYIGFNIGYVLGKRR